MQTAMIRYGLIPVLFFLCLLGSLYINAAGLPGTGTTGSLAGKVLEKKSNAPLAGATVYIPDLKIGAVADAEGHYSFKSLPSGTYLVEVRFVGYKSVTRNITISGSVV